MISPTPGAQLGGTTAQVLVMLSEPCLVKGPGGAMAVPRELGSAFRPWENRQGTPGGENSWVSVLAIRGETL